MKKRIIHLVSNKSWGGGEQYVFDLSRRLLEEDYDVRVVCRKIASVAEKFGRIVSVVYAPLCGYADVISLFRIGRLLTSRRSIVHVHNFRDAFTVIVARWLMRRRDIKIIVTRHLVRKAKTDWLHRFIYNNIDRIVFVSHLAKREFLSAGVKIDDSRISVIHNSIVLPQEQSTAFDIRGEYNIPSDCVMAMYHGRLASEKGVHRLFEAMKKLQSQLALLQG